MTEVQGPESIANSSSVAEEDVALSDLTLERDALQLELSEMVIDPENPDSQESYDELASELAELEDRIGSQTE